MRAQPYLGIEAPIPAELAARMPWLYPPAGFTQFDRNGLQTIPAVAGSTTLTTVQITSSQEGWVRTIGLEAGDWNIVYMRILSGGTPVRDYERIQVPLGNVATPKAVFIPIPVNYPLALEVVSTGAAPVPVRWSLWGWYYNK